MDISDDNLDLELQIDASPLPNRKLKRLKKSKPANSTPLTDNTDNLSSLKDRISPPLFGINSPPLNHFGHSSPPPDLDSHHHTPPRSSPSGPVDGDLETISGNDGAVDFGDESGGPGMGLSDDEEEEELGSRVKSLGAKRALEFDEEEEDGGFGEGERFGEGEEEERPCSWTESMENKKKKKKKAKSDDGFDMIPERMTQKERRSRFEELRAENQRLLRETANAGFKPVPVVQKPISSVLEKIRQRKLEVLKKSVIASKQVVMSNEFDSMRELDVDSDPEDLVLVEDIGSLHQTIGSDENAASQVGKKERLDELGKDRSDEIGDQLARDNGSSMTLNNENEPTFRPPIDDTQDLFTQLPTNNTNNESPDEQPSSPLEENFTPSVLAMNLKLDSAPPDELSDEEDIDKENIEPASHGLVDPSKSPIGDPVKAFMEEEAEEEDDSDNDLNRFQDDEEEEDDEDVEELNAMIATDYKDRPVDAELRNELHQRWLEQQDVAGTEKLFQRLKYGPVLKEAGLLDEEEDDEEGVQDSANCSDDDVAEDLPCKTVAKMNMKKAKQMISQMFSDKDDMYISSDDEETEKNLEAQLLTRKYESKATLVSPAKDENSRDIFERIKKLNDPSEAKKKSKAPAFMDSLHSLRNKNSLSKSSFLGRGSNASLPSLQRRTSNKVRSFIFERDDSNSRSAAFATEGPSEMMQKEIQPKRNPATKISYSQSTSSSQIRTVSPQTETRASLFDILKSASARSGNSSVVDNNSHDTQTQSIFLAFKLDKSINNEGRA